MAEYWIELIKAWEAFDWDLGDTSRIIKVIEAIPADVLANMVISDCGNEILVSPDIPDRRHLHPIMTKMYLAWNHPHCFDAPHLLAIPP